MTDAASVTTPDNRDSTNTGSQATSSLGRRIIFTVAAAIIAGLAVLICIQAANLGMQLNDTSSLKNRTITELMASQISGGVRWKKTDAIDRSYAPMAASPNSQMATLAVFDQQGGLLTLFQSEQLSSADLSGALHQGGDALANGETVSWDVPGAFVIATPVISGKKQDRVGTLVIAWSTEAHDTAVTQAVINNAIVGLIVVVALVALLAFVIARQVTRPLSSITECTTRLVNGNLDVDVPAKDRTDEIGALAHCIQVFKEKSTEIEHLKIEREEMERRAEQQKRNAMQSLASEFEASVGEVVAGLSLASSNMQNSSSTMAGAADQTDQESSNVASAAQRASSNVQTVAAATEQLSISVTEISRQVSTSADIAAEAVNEAETTKTMIRELAGAAQRIGEVVSLITDIAEQTNLLALNATIEAARAGDAGKGFAVVASEVKNLANQTAKATEEIATQVSDIQSATDNAVKANEGIARTISQINDIASGIAAAVEEQGSATHEIARNVEQAAAGTDEVSKSINGVAEAANRTGTVAGEIRELSMGVAQKSDDLRNEVDNFLSKIRAA